MRHASRFQGQKLWTSAQVEDIELTAGLAPMEEPMEARIARIEADVAHLCTDVADIKVDVRTLRDKMDAMAERFDAKFDAMTQRFDTKLDALKDSIGTAKVWALVLYIALTAGLFGTMARGFDWI